MGDQTEETLLMRTMRKLFLEAAISLPRSALFHGGNNPMSTPTLPEHEPEFSAAKGHVEFVNEGATGGFGLEEFSHENTIFGLDLEFVKGFHGNV